MIRNTSAGEASELAWFKSSYSSSSEGDSCIEVAWRKSSYSSGTDGESCVEIATTPATVHVRDSKNLGGPQLALTPAAWAGFVSYASS
ncbi:DUF397 domain-containing protein [Streptomyces sp. WAC01280]|uniref:DUF397 domain-containing protein n=1 Tax=Streptomyces sp. WAC01280 TaxID=2487424 RepID=UPI000F769789|nr:DUF397 domain-containing protein [Streptomyces sp. WAC01280]RSS54029.1 DUF397 domain-containing protein [Streptomyces sp. WAC01280]